MAASGGFPFRRQVWLIRLVESDAVLGTSQLAPWFVRKTKAFALGLLTNQVVGPGQTFIEYRRSLCWGTFNPKPHSNTSFFKAEADIPGDNSWFCFTTARVPVGDKKLQ